MAYPKVTGTSEISAITELIRPWLIVADVRRPAILVDLPVGPYEFEAVVAAWDGMPDSAREIRAAMLARAEDALAALAEAGWLLAGYPRMRFDGHLTLAVVTLARKLVTPPVQHFTDLRVEFEVIRL